MNKSSIIIYGRTQEAKGNVQFYIQTMYLEEPLMMLTSTNLFMEDHTA